MAVIYYNSASTQSTQQEPTCRWFGESFEFLENDLSRRGADLKADNRVVVAVGEAGTLKSRLGYAFLANAFSSDNHQYDCGAILLTSEGIDENGLHSAIMEWGKTDGAVKPQEGRVLVRAVLPRFLSSSNFVFRLKICIREMKKRLGLPVDSSDGAWRLRVVIDNWNTIVDAHASLQRDKQLLQAVFTLLRDEGVYAMIVATQPGSPAAVDVPNRRHDLTRMEATRIHTWPVNFFGDRRIAICTSVPGKDGRRTSVAELSRYNGSEHRLQIKTVFDFYEDLESGKARRVKLKVKLYSANEDGDGRVIPNANTYSSEVSALFGDLFSRPETADEVVSFESIKGYDSFKEYIQNLDWAQLDETLVIQVDEFWKGQSAAVPFAKLGLGFAKSLEIDKGSFPDFSDAVQPERIPLHKDFGIILADRASWYKAKDLEVGDYRLFRARDSVLPLNGPGFDPSLVLIPTKENAAARNLWSLLDEPAGDDEVGEAIVVSKPLRVGHVWNALCAGGEDVRFAGISPEKRPNEQEFLNPSWEVFLRACQIVAAHSGKRAFDIDLRTSESLSSLVLEIWLTRIANRLLRSSTAADLVDMETVISELLIDRNAEPGKRLSLRGMVGEYSSDFLDSLRLVIGFLPGRFREAKSQLSPPDREAVAVRTWFATAPHCQFGNRNLTPLRIPGRFCIRGDWYLAAAKGSRSLLLAESAIRKLVSEPMNRRRLREGIGLPVVNAEKMGVIESALHIPDPNLGSCRSLRLEEIVSVEPQPGTNEHNGFFCPLVRFFRSHIPDYDASSEDFYLMITSLLRKLHPLREIEIHAAFEVNGKSEDPGIESPPTGEQDGTRETLQEVTNPEIIKLVEQFVAGGNSGGKPAKNTAT